MKVRSFRIALASLALLLPAGAASAHYWGHPYGERYVTYRPVIRYVPRTVIVRERVWRPVVHRVYYRRVYYVRPYHYARPYYGFRARYYDYPTRYAYADERWADERWEHRW